jgi:methyl-accepting chemotaxis protein
MAAQLNATAGNLVTATAEILSSTAQQAAGAHEQSAAIAQTATTIDEVRGIAEQSSRHAQGVAELARRTADISLAGRQAIADGIAAMGQIRLKVEGIAATNLALSEQAQTIGQIIATVSAIAAQSNMLALNAAVEAARAGEAGRGFAVVAGAVRDLAEQSRAATGQVKEVLSEIQRGVNAAVMATEEGMKRTDTGVRLVGSAGDSLRQLAEGVVESAQAATQIAAAVGQQLAGMEQIATAMQQVRQVAAQTVASAQQSERAAEELGSLAAQLRELVAQYQL